MTGSRPAAAQDSLEELVQRAAQGDVEAYARLIRLHNEEMTRVAFVTVGDLGAAAEATEAAWFTAWGGLRRKRTPEALGPWLCALAAAAATDLARRRDALGASVPEPDRRTDLPTDDALVSALTRLDPGDRALLALRHVAGMSMDEVRQAVRRSRPSPEVRLAQLTDALAALAPLGTNPAEIDRLLGQRLRAFANVPVRPIDADATARRARAEESLERTRVLSVAIGVVAGLLVAAHPYLARLLFGR